jgi:hypothetical protein
LRRSRNIGPVYFLWDPEWHRSSVLTEISSLACLEEPSNLINGVLEMKEQSKIDFGMIFSSLDKKQRKEMLRFLKWNAYEKKTGESIQALIKTAREGNKLNNHNALFELIRIDKQFLFTVWAKQIIFEEMEKENKRFFENLGDAVKYFPRQTRNTNLIKQLEKTIIEYPYSLKILNDNNKLQNILDALIKEGIVDDSLADIDVVKKLLRRHGLIQ